MVFHICNDTNNYWQLYPAGSLFKATGFSHLKYSSQGVVPSWWSINQSISAWLEALSQWSHHRTAFHFQAASLSWRAPDLLMYWVWLSWSPRPHSSPDSALLCAGGWEGVDNTPVLWVLLSSAGTATALSSIPHSPVGWSWERTQLGQLTQINQMDTPYHRMSAQI